MKYEQISRRFTEVVTEYIQNGYIFNTSTMAGSQGEDAKADLTNGKEVVRVILDRFHEGLHEGLRILVGRAPLDAEPNSERHDTIWNNKLEIISEERFYEVGFIRGGKKWYGSKEEREAAKELAFARWSQKNEGRVVSLPDNARAVALRWVKKQPRRKSTKLSAISEVYVSYAREWNGKMAKHYYVKVGSDALRIR